MYRTNRRLVIIQGDIVMTYRKKWEKRISPCRNSAVAVAVSGHMQYICSMKYAIRNTKSHHVE